MDAVQRRIAALYGKQPAREHASTPRLPTPAARRIAALYGREENRAQPSGRQLRGA